MSDKTEHEQAVLDLGDIERLRKNAYFWRRLRGMLKAVEDAILDGDEMGVELAKLRARRRVLIDVLEMADRDHESAMLVVGEDRGEVE